MAELYELNGIVFVWNTDKARANRSKHAVTFEQAAEAFFDPFFRVVDASAGEEARNAIIGMDVRWNLLYVVHLEIEDDRVRVVAARRATPHERRIYED